jgi:hypothetical protein
VHSILAPTQKQAATFYKFKAKFGGMDVSDGRRLKHVFCQSENLIRVMM